jgi:molybdenum cofactor cytidylyltransferase
MIFAELPVEECAGAVLAHALRNGEVSFKKGRVLSAADIESIKKSGRRTITVARLEADDVGEDAAAGALGALLGAEGLRVEAPFTGRVNLYAREGGILRIDAAQVDAINEVDEAITLATLADYAAMEPDQMAATVKIIPFAVKRAALDACLVVARQKPVLSFHPFRPRKVALIQTELAANKPALLDKTVAVTNRRLAAMGGGAAVDLRAPHEPAALGEVIQGALADGAGIVLVMGGSAIIDRRDVIPAAIERSGGKVVQFGMPVDPGNLILLGEIGGTAVVGLPGCARTPKLNGFDWVLQRLMADIPVTARDLRRMGVGGLLNEIPARGQPRDARPRSEARRPRVAGLVMAAGRSSRMGTNKLLMDDDGKAIVARVVEQALAADLAEIIVVTGHQETAVRAALADHKVRFVSCPDYADGMSASLRSGLKALPADIDAALVLLGDMPRVGTSLLRRMIAAFNPTEGRAIIVPSFQGKRGNPVLWDRRFFGEMTELVTEIAAEDGGIFLDIDTPEAYRTLKDKPGE